MVFPIESEYRAGKNSRMIQLHREPRLGRKRFGGTSGLRIFVENIGVSN
jgi:hypothetical protein